MDLGLRGKKAAVMGATEGIGLAVARLLAEEGCDLVLGARRIERVKEVASELAKRHDVRVHPVAMDARDAHDLERFFDAAEMEGGHLDALVTNHGGPPHGRLLDLDDEDWEDAFDLIVLSAVRATRLAVPMMPAGGSIVHVVSSAAKEPVDDLTLSNALRPAVIGLAKSTSLELAPRGIRVNSVLPGLTETARLTALVEARAAEKGTTYDEALADRAKAIPLGRLGRPEDVAATVVWLLSPRAAQVTGQAWAVDGGMLRGIL